MADITGMVSGVWGGTTDKGSSIIAKLSANVELIMITILVAICLWIFIRFVQHRKQVIIYELVKGGYVKRGGRYTDNNDKKTNLEYLRPMFGSNRLPMFPGKYWQKVKGLPVFGIQRVIHLVKINSYTYKPLKINHTDAVVSVKDYNTTGFTYMEEYRKFINERKRADIGHILSFVAPSVVILAALGFLAFAIYTQSGINEISTDRIIQATNTMIDYASKANN